MASPDLTVTVKLDDATVMLGKLLHPDRVPSLDQYMAELETLTAAEIAEQTHIVVSTRGKLRMIEYVLDGLALYVFKMRGLFKEIGYSSFNEYISDPETAIGKTYGHQCVASIALFHVQFGAAINTMTAVGFRKFQLINPEANALQDAVRDGSMSYEVAQAKAWEWLYKARTMSDEDLEAELHQEPSNGGYETYFSAPVVMKQLKEMTAEEMLRFFGIGALDDKDIVVIQIRGN